AAHVIHDLWRLTQGKAVMVTDVGQHQMWEAQYYKHERPRQLLTSGGLGTMGFALPAAIGARFALPHEEIWVVAGDGGFQMAACARRQGHSGDRLPRRAGRQRLPDGAGERGPARHDPPPAAAAGIRGGHMKEPVAHTFVVSVEDRPGVLNRVVSLVRRRGFNI